MSELKSKADSAQKVFNGLAFEETTGRAESTDSFVTVDSFDARGARHVSWHLSVIDNDVDARIVMQNGGAEPAVLDATENPEAAATVSADGQGYVWAVAKGGLMSLQIKSNGAGSPGVVRLRGYKA